jgi:hypothetical protein
MLSPAVTWSFPPTIACCYLAVASTWLLLWLLLLLCRYMRWLPADMDEQRRRRLAKLKLHWAAVDDHVLAVSAASTQGCELLLFSKRPPCVKCSSSGGHHAAVQWDGALLRVCCSAGVHGIMHKHTFDSQPPAAAAGFWLRNTMP